MHRRRARRACVLMPAAAFAASMPDIFMPPPTPEHDARAERATIDAADVAAASILPRRLSRHICSAAPREAAAPPIFAMPQRRQPRRRRARRRRRRFTRRAFVAAACARLFRFQMPRQRRAARRFAGCSAVPPMRFAAAFARRALFTRFACDARVRRCASRCRRC